MEQKAMLLLLMCLAVIGIMYSMGKTRIERDPNMMQRYGGKMLAQLRIGAYQALTWMARALYPDGETGIRTYESTVVAQK